MNFNICAFFILLVNVELKLIGSTTLKPTDVIELDDRNVTYTVWIQVRHLVFQQMSLQNQIFPLVITDQQNNIQLLIKITKENQLLNIIFIAEDRREENFSQLSIRDIEIEWIQYQIQREICFKRIVGFDIDVINSCNRSFIATLYLTSLQPIKVLFYDSNQFENENVITQLSSQENSYSIDVYKDQLQLITYFKLNCNNNFSAYQEYIFSLLEDKLKIDINIASGILFIYVLNRQLQKSSEINQITIQQCQQWNQIKLQFQDTNIILQIQINGQLYQEIINLEQYQIKYLQTQLEYKSNTFIIFYNSVVTYDKLLVIHNIKNEIDQQLDFCDPQCQQCQIFQCLNYCKNGEFFNEKSQTCQTLNNPILYNYFFNQYESENKEENEEDKLIKYVNKCQNCQLNYDLTQCRLFFDQYENQRIGCTFQQLLFQDVINQLQIQQIIPYDFEFTLLKFMQSKVLQYERDLKLFTLKNKDIYLTYFDMKKSKVYCIFEYHYNQTCKKNMKQCWFQTVNCDLCHQRYSSFHNKCIKCQQNCLACTILNKQIKCILSMDNYFLDNRGLLQKCNQESNILICQDKDVIIQNLINSGNNVCQHYFYSIENNQCINPQDYKLGSKDVEYPNHISIIQQKLEIQDMILIYNIQDFKNKEIKLLINLQQTLKIIKSLQDNKILMSSQRVERLQHFSHLMGIQQEDLEQQKITLDVKIFLGSHLQYQNHIFIELKEIYYELKLFYYKYIQFNMVLLQEFPNFYPKLPEIYQYLIDYENYVNTSFILNITFQLSPRIVFSECNSFYFKANKVILNNLTFINNSYDFSCDQQGGFIISSQDIRILNVNFQKLEYERLFVFYNFQNLEILNLQIYESKLKQFLQAKSVKKFNLKIQNILIFNCSVWQFIQCSGVQNAQIGNIYIYQSSLEGLFIQAKGELEIINLVNLVFIQVKFQESFLLSLEWTKIMNQQLATNVTIQDVYIFKSMINKSIIFYLQEIEYIKLSHLYVSMTEFYEGEFIEFNKHNLHIDNLFINSTIMIDSNLVVFQGIAIQVYQVFIQIKFSESSCIFNFYTGNIHLENINFQLYSINTTSLINIKSNIVQLNSILITNQSSSSIILNSFRLIEISSLFNQQIHIQNIRFKNLKIIDSVILIISTENKLTIEKLLIINVNLIARQIKQLMQMYFGKKILDEISIINTDLNSFVDDFTFIQFGNEQQMIELNKLKIINLLNQQPSIHVFLIKNEFAKIRIYNIYAKNIIYINLLSSESCSFKIINCKLQNIDSSRYSIQFIFCWEKTSVKFLTWYGLIIIDNLSIENFNGGLLRILGIQGVVAYIQNINFNNSKLQRDAFFVEQIHYVSINNLSITNRNSSQGTNKFLFYVKANYLFINQVMIYSINQQFLLLQDFKVLSLKNVYISNIQSNKFIELRSNISRRVIIFNIFIQNSKIFIESLFQLMLNQDRMYIKNLEIININVKNEIFSLNFKQQSQSKISDVIIKNVVSQNRLFYCTSNINFNNIQIINTSQLIIFQNQGTTKYINGLIVNIFQQCKLSVSDMTIVNESEIVNSNIIQDELKLQIKKSLFEGNSNRQDQTIKIYISLNEGAQMFKYKNLAENLFQVQFDEDNNYLYLPSGRDIQTYRYFYFKTQQYQRLYDSISFVNIISGQQIQCILSQSIDNYTIVQKQINIKPGVNIMENLIFTLNPNYKDKHIQMDLNCSQNQYFITYRTLIKTFNCQLGEYMYKEKCLECNIEQKLYSVGYNQEYCIYKDSNKIQEIKLGQIKLNLQYWRFSYANKYIEYCPNENCLGGWQTGDQSCQVGYIGGICQECDIDNIRGNGNYGKIDNQCYLCYFDSKIYFKGLLLIIYQLLLVCISYYSNKQQSQQYLFLRISLRKFTELLQRQNVDQVTILLKLYYNYLLTIFILKDLFNFGYIISISLNFIYNPNITAIPQFDCLINSVVPIPIQYTQLLYKIVIPLVLFNISVIIYIILVKFGYIKYSIYIIFVSLYTIYQQNQIIIIQSLIKLSSKVKYSNIYWTLENLAVQYYSQVHQHYMYVLILPLIFIFTLIFISMIQIINQRIFNKLKLSILIFRQYKLQFTFWDQMRTLFIYLFMLTFYSLSENYTILLSLIFATITLIQPFQLSHLNKIDLYIQCFSLYSYFAMLIIQEKDQYLSYFAFILSNSILLRIYLKYLQHGFNIQYRKLKLKTFNLIYKKLYYKKYVTNLDKQNKIIYYYKLVKENRKRSIKLDQAVYETNSAHQAQELKSETNIEIEMAPIHYMFTEQ